MKGGLTGEKTLPPACRISIYRKVVINPFSSSTFPTGEGKEMQNAECRMRNEGNGWRGASFACPRNRSLSGSNTKRPPPRGRRSDGHAGIRQTATFRAIRHFADAKCRAQQVEGFLREAPWGTPLSGALWAPFSGHREKGA